jgi:formylglycine-generating enzyme required for sulfatase activity
LPANAWGLHDMHGNVWEWCADRYDADYYQSGPVIDPPGALKAERRCARGGSWYNNGQFCRASSRGSLQAAVREPYVGFRVALTMPERKVQAPSPD